MQSMAYTAQIVGETVAYAKTSATASIGEGESMDDVVEGEVIEEESDETPSPLLPVTSPPTVESTALIARGQITVEELLEQSGIIEQAMHQLEETQFGPLQSKLLDHAAADSAAPMGSQASRFVEHQQPVVFQ